MKKLFNNQIKIKILLGLLSMLLVFGTAQTSFAAAVQTPEQTAVQFYKWYIGELNRNRDPRTQQKTKLVSYLSKRFAKWVYSIPGDEYDADVFISAQDFDEEWARAISTSKASVKGNVATLNVTLGVDPNGKVVKSKWKNQLRLKMVKEGGVWKIDDIKGS